MNWSHWPQSLNRHVLDKRKYSHEIQFLHYFIGYAFEIVLFSKEAVDRWIELYNVIQTRCTAPTPGAVGLKRKVNRDDDPIAYSPDELIARRNAKADRVQELSIEFLARMCELVQEFATYYLHGLYHHLPDQIRSCPVDIMDASGSGIEQINQLTKRVIQ